MELVLLPVLAQTELKGRKIHVGPSSARFVCEFLSSTGPVLSLKYFCLSEVSQISAYLKVIFQWFLVTGY